MSTGLNGSTFSSPKSGAVFYWPGHQYSFCTYFLCCLFIIWGINLDKIRIPLYGHMQPAIMIKTESPYMELYTIKALSEADLDFANENFKTAGLPFKVIRESGEATA